MSTEKLVNGWPEGIVGNAGFTVRGLLEGELVGLICIDGKELKRMRGVPDVVLEPEVNGAPPLWVRDGEDEGDDVNGAELKLVGFEVGVGEVGLEFAEAASAE